MIFQSKTIPHQSGGRTGYPQTIATIASAGTTALLSAIFNEAEVLKRFVAKMVVKKQALLTRFIYRCIIYKWLVRDIIPMAEWEGVMIVGTMLCTAQRHALKLTQIRNGYDDLRRNDGVALFQ